MSKSILVADTPESCVDCPCYCRAHSGSYAWCGVMDRDLEKEDIITRKPDWCPRETYQRNNMGMS